MRKLEKITITDYSQYEEGRCNTGGAYIFSTVYHRNDDGTYTAAYSTSADFPYCPYCGSIYSGNECSCGKRPDVLTAEELLSIVLQAAANPDFEIDCVWEEIVIPTIVWDDDEEFPTDEI